MAGIITEFLFEIALEVPVLALGETPYGERRIARFEGGNFEGPTSQLCRSTRVAGRAIIAPRRNNSAHLHRPWRATSRFCATPPDIATLVLLWPPDAASIRQNAANSSTPTVPNLILQL